MNTVWDNAAAHILKVEGGLIDHANDPGGITKYGISLRFLRGEHLDLDGDGDVDADDVRGLTPDRALAVYKRFFWEPYGYAQFPAATATKLFDMAVNMGAPQAHKLLQKAMWGFGIHLAIDGKLGSASIASVRMVTMQPGGEPGLLASVRTAQRCFYEGLVIKTPKFASFIDGWVNRTYSC